MKIKIATFLLSLSVSSQLLSAASSGGHVVGWGGISIPYEAGSVFTNIGAGWDHGMAIRNDGKLFEWGRNWEGEAAVPASISNVIAAGGGEQHTLVLTADGHVHAWGDVYQGSTNPPSNLTNVIAIAAGEDTDVALLSDGTVAAWGYNYSGQANVPPGLSNVVAIAAASSFCLALKNDGTVVSWGDSDGIPPTDLTNVIAIASGDAHSLALRSDGTVVAWGWNRFGQTNVPSGLTNVIAVAAGGQHSMALKNDGTVIVWGENYDGPYTWEPLLPPTNLDHVVSIAAGFETAIALRDDGSVVCWGDPMFADTVGVNCLSNVVAIAGGLDDALALGTDGRVVAVPTSWYAHPAPDNLSNAVAIASGFGQNLALRTDGTIVGWGDDYYSKITGGSGLSNVVAIAASGNASMAILSDATVAQWGRVPAPIPNGLSDVVTIAPGSGEYIVGPADTFGLALRNDGRVIGWGNNSSGQASPPSNLTNAIAISSGAFFGMALRSDGTVIAWGDNSGGQTNVPADLTNVVAIDAGWECAVALKNDGTVVAWGDNSYGMLNVPGTLHNVTAISAGNRDFCLAITGDGSPTLTPQPTNAFAFTGETTMLTTLAVSSLPLSYQWLLNGTNIESATNNTLPLPHVATADAGRYACIVSNSLGTVTNMIWFAVADHPATSFDSAYSRFDANGFHIRLTGLTGHGNLIIYASTNLIDWESIYTNPPSISPLSFVDPGGNTSARFYRAVEIP